MRKRHTILRFIKKSQSSIHLYCTMEKKLQLINKKGVIGLLGYVYFLSKYDIYLLILQGIFIVSCVYIYTWIHIYIYMCVCAYHCEVILQIRNRSRKWNL